MDTEGAELGRLADGPPHIVEATRRECLPGGRTSVRTPMDSLRRARWELSVLAELADPGEMQLSAVFDDAGQVVDFEWRRLSPVVTLALGCAGANLVGHRLLVFFEGSPLGEMLFDTYRLVLHSRTARIARVVSQDGACIHQVSESTLGVRVRVTNTTAVERVISAQHALHALEARANLSSGQDQAA
jgi:hypothetical protein